MIYRLSPKSSASVTVCFFLFVCVIGVFLAKRVVFVERRKPNKQRLSAPPTTLLSAWVTRRCTIRRTSKYMYTAGDLTLEVVDLINHSLQLKTTHVFACRSRLQHTQSRGTHTHTHTHTHKLCTYLACAVALQDNAAGQPRKARNLDALQHRVFF